jgi:hypothetical protein
MEDISFNYTSTDTADFAATPATYNKLLLKKLKEYLNSETYKVASRSYQMQLDQQIASYAISKVGL